MTFGTLKFTSRRKLNSAYLYTNLHIQIRVAGMTQKTDFFFFLQCLFNTKKSVKFVGFLILLVTFIKFGLLANW